MSRAALFAFGTGTLAAASGCSSSDMPVPVYGSPVMFDAGDDGGSTASDATVVPDAPTADAAPDAPVAVPAYGAPGQPVEPVDASDDVHVGVTPLYGISPGH